MTWALFQLSQSPETQKRLRDELRTLHTDEPTMDDLNSIPFLDNFVKEVFRYYPSFTWSAREALQDDVIPLQDPFVDTRGRVCHELRCAVLVVVASISELKAHLRIECEKDNTFSSHTIRSTGAKPSGARMLTSSSKCRTRHSQV